MTQLCSFPRNRNDKAVCMRNFLPNVTGKALLEGKKNVGICKVLNVFFKKKMRDSWKTTKKRSEETHKKLIQQYFIFGGKL
jgi:hypothetical protein